MVAEARLVRAVLEAINMMRMALLSTGCGLLLLACVDSETDPVIDYLSGGGAGYTEVEPSGGSEGGSEDETEGGNEGKVVDGGAGKKDKGGEGKADTCSPVDLKGRHRITACRRREGVADELAGLCPF